MSEELTIFKEINQKLSILIYQNTIENPPFLPFVGEPLDTYLTRLKLNITAAEIILTAQSRNPNYKSKLFRRLPLWDKVIKETVDYLLQGIKQEFPELL